MDAGIACVSKLAEKLPSAALIVAGIVTEFNVIETLPVGYSEPRLIVPPKDAVDCP
jgi:hypothetical protein